MKRVFCNIITNFCHLAEGKITYFARGELWKNRMKNREKKSCLVTKQLFFSIKINLLFFMHDSSLRRSQASDGYTER